ncbi:MAG: hypothetical protein WCF18_17560, partial [Chthoniobacteraceae bacterium]
ADGTPISCSNSLSKSNAWPFYAPILAGKGSVSAPVSFRDIPAISDLDAPETRWYKPAIRNAKRYADGWPDGIHVDLLGSKFAIPAPAAQTSIFSGLAVPDSGGNATAAFTHGNLPSPGMSMAININPKNIVTVLDHPEAKLTLTMLFPYDRLEGPTHRRGRVATGVFSGSFLHPLSDARASFKGVIFQKQESAFGYFLGPFECGAVTLTPQEP